MRLRKLLDPFSPLNLPDVEVLSQLLDDMTTGVAIVDEDARLIFANIAALDLIAAGDPLLEREGKLLVTRGNEEFTMKKAIATAAKANRRDVRESVCLARAAGRPLQITIAPLSTHRGRSLVTLFIGEDAGVWCG
ncbi:MAG: hypothetical protein ABIP63_08105 [Thermoanaerobaculia bacterium]